MNNNHDTNFKITDNRSPDTQARVAKMPEEITPELKACGHCGSSGSIMRRAPFQRACIMCGAEGPEGKNPEEADFLWNRRTPEMGLT